MDLQMMFFEGGSWMYIVLATGLGLSLLSGVLGLALGGLAWRWPTPIIWLLAALVVISGSIGTWLGAAQAVDVLGAAAPFMRAKLAAAGSSVAVYPSILAWFMVPGVLLSAALPLGLTTAIRPGPEPRPDAGGLAGVLLGVSLGLVVAALILGMGGALSSAHIPLSQLVLSVIFTLGFTLAALLGSARRPGAHAPLDEGRRHEARLGGTRLFIGLSGVFSMFALAKAGGMMADAQVAAALAMASGEMRAALLGHGYAQLEVVSIFGWALAMPPLFMALGSTMGFIGRLDQRNLVFGLGAPAALALVWIGQLPAASSLTQLQTIAGLGGPWQAAAENLGDAIPSSTGDLPGAYCVAVRDGKWHGTAPIATPTCTDPLTESSKADHWVLALRKGTPAKVLVDRQWGENQSELGVLVKLPNTRSDASPLLAYGAAQWTWLAALPPEGLNNLVPLDSRASTPRETVVVWDTAEGDRFLRIPADSAPLTRETLAASEPFALNRNDPEEARGTGDKGARLVFVPGEHWSIDDLLDRCSPVNNGNHCVVLALDSLPFPTAPEAPDAK